jgi:release factor glutamine methyltransferase
MHLCGMPGFSDAYYELVNKLQSLYDVQEASAIAHQLLEHITGMNRLQRITGKDRTLTTEQAAIYDIMTEELLNGRPLQYVLGYAWFLGRKFKVDEHVLIPRPETEELVDWVVKECKMQNEKHNILDVGTGSGCIPVSLKLALPEAQITSCDISAAAIAVAEENAAALSAQVNFVRADFLNEQEWGLFGKFDIIVSNPPYIPISEIDSLHINVRNYEPAAALFVEGDAQLFYRAIAAFGKMHLNESGSIFCEVHAGHAVATGELFKEAGYQTELRKDMHGNFRMLKAHKK